jgi:hypothetical protein
MNLIPTCGVSPGSLFPQESRHFRLTLLHKNLNTIIKAFCIIKLKEDLRGDNEMLSKNTQVNRDQIEMIA